MEWLFSESIPPTIRHFRQNPRQKRRPRLPNSPNNKAPHPGTEPALPRARRCPMFLKGTVKGYGLVIPAKGSGKVLGLDPIHERRTDL